MAVVLKRIMAKFDDIEPFERALGSLKAAGFTFYEAYGPINLEDLADLMPQEVPPRAGRGLGGSVKSIAAWTMSVLVGRGGSPVRFHATVGALTGLVVFFGTCVLTALIFGLIVGGKPPVSNVPYIIPAYEGTILLGAIGAFLAVLFYAKMAARGALPPNYDPRFSGDRFGIDVSCEADKAGTAIELLKNAGAVEVNEY